MITHNGKNLSVATHHGMPIYAATMGGKMVIGGKWLLSATLQAILAAFGSAEGTEVIAKTNDYLNRIATTDPQRALLLANFINEDPLLVCSLGLEVEGVTMPIRWLVGDGTAYINTGYTYKAEDIFIRFRSNGENSNNWLGGVREQQNGVYVGFGFNYWGTSVGNPYTNYGSVESIYRDANHKAPSKLTLARSGIKFEYDGSVVLQAACTTLSKDFETAHSFYLLSAYDSTLSRLAGNMDLQDAIFSRNEVESHHFIPCKNPNGNDYGVLDMVTAEWKGNSAGSGAFGIAYTRNGQPWTPSTP